VSAVLAPPALCAAALALLRPERVSWGFAVALLCIWIVAALLSRLGGPSAARALLVLSGFGVLLWPEMALRLSSFRFEHAGVIQFGYPRPEKLILAQHDPELFWKLPPGERVNSEGFPGPEFTIPKPAGSTRILFFGDSCTQQGLPRTVATRLNRLGGLAPLGGAGAGDAEAQPVEAINFGVSGYSSHQGLVLAERWTERLEADAAVIYFGWNDHWQAYGASDAERAANLSRSVLTRLMTASRTLQWLVSVTFPAQSKPLATPRVTLEQYRDNITAIGDLTADRGGTVVLVTAPSSHEQLGVPDYLIDKGFAASKENALIWHRAYNAEVRRIAIRRHWPIADLQREARERLDVAPLFTKDGIHFTAAGMAWAGQAIAEALQTRQAASR
jgi:lysophospholipase L1-like esterase